MSIMDYAASPEQCYRKLPCPSLTKNGAKRLSGHTTLPVTAWFALFGCSDHHDKFGAMALSTTPSTILAFTINSAKQRVGHEALWNCALRAQNILGLIGIFFPAFVTTNNDLVSEHRRRRKCVRFREWDVMLVGGIPLVMETAVFADHDPKIFGVVEHCG